MTNGFPVPVKKIRFDERKGSLTDYNLTVGQDNPSSDCIVGEVQEISQGITKDHSGPYDGITMGLGC